MATAAVAFLPAALPAVAQAKLGHRTLREGMQGRDVHRAQVLLHRLGHSVVADGQFGPNTESAVEAFEGDRDLRVNGRLSRHDDRVLRRASREARAQRRASRRLAADPAAAADMSGTGGISAGADIGAPGEKAVLNSDGTATAPASAPTAVKRIIAAGNQIASKPYVYGGGHGRWHDSGYDCSGSVSYALHGAGLLDTAMPSGSFESWGASGRGRWVTLYANAGHIYMVVAGLRFDTSGADPSRWQSDMRSGSGYVVRHPQGL